MQFFPRQLLISNTSFPVQCERTQVVPGDELDNDCDGKIDEEVRDGRDNDGDGAIDEDLELVSLRGSSIANDTKRSYIAQKILHCHQIKAEIFL